MQLRRMIRSARLAPSLAGTLAAAIPTLLPLLLALAPAAAMAQAWPAKSVTIVVPFPPGGGTDAFARPLAAHLNKLLGQSFIIDNRGGAGGTIGASIASKAAGDGYTLFMGAAHHAIAPAMYPKLDYDMEKDFIPTALLATPPQVIVANPKNIAADDLKSLIDYLRANPKKVNYGSAGSGTSHHLAGELFKQLSKTDITHVPYKGAGPALQDLIGGQIDLLFDGLGSSAAHIRGGRIKAIAVAAPRRSPAFPNVPTASEAGLPGYEVSTWYAMWAPKGTPKAVNDRIHAELLRAMNTPELKQVWLNNGSEVPTLSPEQFGRFFSDELRRWGKIASDSGAKLD
jgi:tripartite-type tricarboxylate transporter receptor subunit TctC